MSTRLLRAYSSARLGVSNNSRLSLPSIWRTISASSKRLLNRSSTIRTVLRCARASASSETTAPLPGLRGCAALMAAAYKLGDNQDVEAKPVPHIYNCTLHQRACAYLPDLASDCVWTASACRSREIGVKDAMRVLRWGNGRGERN